MPKLEIEFEITGVKLRIKGESEDVVARAADVQRRLQGAVQALGNLGDGALAPTVPALPPPAHAIPAAPLATPAAAAATAKRTSTRKTAAGRVKADAIDFTHDADKYGLPKQEWSGATKAMWLLYMLEKQAQIKEAGVHVLAATFNKHFREFGALIAANLKRDLGALRKKGGVVNLDSNQDPEAWFLLDGGKKEIDALLAGATSPAE